jgi:hypothetical protein
MLELLVRAIFAMTGSYPISRLYLINAVPSAASQIEEV